MGQAQDECGDGQREESERGAGLTVAHPKVGADGTEEVQNEAGRGRRSDLWHREAGQ